MAHKKILDEFSDVSPWETDSPMERANPFLWHSIKRRRARRGQGMEVQGPSFGQEDLTPPPELNAPPPLTAEDYPERPTYERAPEPALWKKILGVGLAGVGEAGVRGTGARVADSVFNAPERRGLREHELEVQDWRDQVGIMDEAQKEAWRDYDSQVQQYGLTSAYEGNRATLAAGETQSQRQYSLGGRRVDVSEEDLDMRYLMGDVNAGHQLMRIKNEQTRTGLMGERIQNEADRNKMMEPYYKARGEYWESGGAGRTTGDPGRRAAYGDQLYEDLKGIDIDPMFTNMVEGTADRETQTRFFDLRRKAVENYMRKISELPGEHRMTEDIARLLLEAYRGDADAATRAAERYGFILDE